MAHRGLAVVEGREEVDEAQELQSTKNSSGWRRTGGAAAVLARPSSRGTEERKLGGRRFHSRPRAGASATGDGGFLSGFSSGGGSDRGDDRGEDVLGGGGR